MNFCLVFVDEVLGLGPIEPLLKDPTVSEIMINGRLCVYVEKKGRLHPTDVRFTSDTQLRAVIDRIVAPIGRRVDESMPLCDARQHPGRRLARSRKYRFAPFGARRPHGHDPEIYG